MINKKTGEIITKVKAFMSGQPILRAWLFGSFSRGEETSDSDIDILVDFDHSKGTVSLFKMGGMLMDLQDLLGIKVDLVDNQGLMSFARESVERDKILIYERPT